MNISRFIPKNTRYTLMYMQLTRTFSHTHKPTPQPHIVSQTDTQLTTKLLETNVKDLEHRVHNIEKELSTVKKKSDEFIDTYSMGTISTIFVLFGGLIWFSH